MIYKALIEVPRITEASIDVPEKVYDKNLK